MATGDLVDLSPAPNPQKEDLSPGKNKFTFTVRAKTVAGDPEVFVDIFKATDLFGFPPPAANSVLDIYWDANHDYSPTPPAVTVTVKRPQ